LPAATVRGKEKATGVVGHCNLVIVWRLLSDPTALFHDLGSNF
jgi:hypothetical protein